MVLQPFFRLFFFFKVEIVGGVFYFFFFFTMKHTFARQRAPFSSSGKSENSQVQSSKINPIFQDKSCTRPKNILSISMHLLITHQNWVTVYSALQKSVSAKGHWYCNGCHHTFLAAEAFWGIYSYNFCLV